MIPIFQSKGAKVRLDLLAWTHLYFTHSVNFLLVIIFLCRNSSASAWMIFRKRIQFQQHGRSFNHFWEAKAGTVFNCDGRNLNLWTFKFILHTVDKIIGGQDTCNKFWLESFVWFNAISVWTLRDWEVVRSIALWPASSLEQRRSKST